MQDRSRSASVHASEPVPLVWSNATLVDDAGSEKNSLSAWQAADPTEGGSGATGLWPSTHDPSRSQRSAPARSTHSPWESISSHKDDDEPANVKISAFKDKRRGSADHKGVASDAAEPESRAHWGPDVPPELANILFVNSKIMAQDRLKDWYKATIIEVHPQDLCVTVKFKDWSSKYNERIPVLARRLRPLGRKEHGSHSSKTKSKDSYSSKASVSCERGHICVEKRVFFLF